MKFKSIILLSLFFSAVFLISCSNRAKTQPDITATAITLTDDYTDSVSADTAEISTAPNLKKSRDDINAAIETTDKIEYAPEDYYEDWTNLDPDYVELTGITAAVSGNGAKVKGNTVTITKGGIYVISGLLDNGQIIVDLNKCEMVQLVLNGTKIKTSLNPAIYVKKAEKTIISLEKGTDNFISVTGNGKKDKPEIEAAIYSNSSLTLNGTGSLTVNAKDSNGITSLDTVKIMDGNLTIHSLGNSLTGSDMLAVNGGNLNINSGKNGIISTNGADISKGFVELDGGKFTITAAGDGIKSENALLITGGEYAITSSNVSSKSYGLTAKSDLTINGGTFSIDTAEDALSCNETISINDGNLSLSSDKTGIHAKSTLTITNGLIDLKHSQNGLESGIITVLDGKLNIKAKENGIKLTASTGDHYLTVNGGYIKIDADNNAMDINGSIFMTNGTLISIGRVINSKAPENNNVIFDISGGLFIAAGRQIAITPSDNSTQYSIAYQFPVIQQKEQLVHMEDNKGNPLLTFSPDKYYETFAVSSPDLEQNKTYSIYSGGTNPGDETDGLYTDGNYHNGKLLLNFKISNIQTWLSEDGEITNQIIN